MGNEVAENLGNAGADAVVDIDMSHTRRVKCLQMSRGFARPVSEEQRKRSSVGRPSLSKPF